MAVTTETSPAAAVIRPFTAEISDREIEDLRARIAATRLPDREPREGRTVDPLGSSVPPEGVELATMDALDSVLGRRLRPPQDRDAAERSAAVRDRDR